MAQRSRRYQERAFTHLGRGRPADGDDRRGEDRRGRRRSWRRRSRPRGSWGALRSGPSRPRRSGAPATATSSPPRYATRCGCRGRGPVRAGGGAARVRRRRAHARPRPDGELGVVDVGGGSSELVVGQVPGPGLVVGVVRRSAPASWPTATCAPIRRRRRSSPRPRARSRRSSASSMSPHPAEAVAVGGSAASLSEARRAAARRGRVRPRAGPARGRARREVARRFGLDVERVRLLPAGLLILQAAAGAVRAPAQGRPAAASARAC